MSVSSPTIIKTPVSRHDSDIIISQGGFCENPHRRKTIGVGRIAPIIVAVYCLVMLLFSLWVEVDDLLVVFLVYLCL